ncbi:MAG: YggS family pyridoxal phosphate-dependent enzyme [Alphaproteobacteria bacterium]|nr:YggS family pyridoxal phosphate-dependent enzyme [Alphaproteobacteria bacterium]
MAAAPDTVAGRLGAVRAKVADAARAAGRSADAVTLVAVSKTHPAETIEQAIAAGQLVFGENRVQEAAGKFPALRARHAGIELRLIGHLQSNKAAEAVALFDVIETIGSAKLARAVAREMQRQGRHPRCLIQVNTGSEPQKSGVAPAEVEALLRLCRDELGIAVDGLMCIPPVEEEPDAHFRMLALSAARLGLGVLSMGMSADYPQAIRAGATHVRVGTAIFGTR